MLKEVWRMRTFWENWKNLTTPQRIVTVLHAAVSALTLLLAVVQLLGRAVTIQFFIPLLGMASLCQAYLYWNTDRKVAWISLGAAVWISICAAATFLL